MTEKSAYCMFVCIALILLFSIFSTHYLNLFRCNDEMGNHEDLSSVGIMVKSVHVVTVKLFKLVYG